MLGLTARWVLGAALLGVTGALVFMHHRQNRARRIGGAIAPAKLLWLGYAVFTWFILSPTLALAPAVAGPLRILLGSFAICMWARGPVELFMMYVTKNWRPPYGIAHDALCLVVLVGAAAWQAPALMALSEPLDLWVLAFSGVLAVSLVLEMIYARAFLRLVGRRTVGDDAVWFASAEDPAFRRIVRLTAVCNGPLLAFLGVFLVVLLRGGT